MVLKIRFELILTKVKQVIPVASTISPFERLVNIKKLKINLAIKNKPKAKIINKIKLVVICQNKTNILIFVFPQFLF